MSELLEIALAYHARKLPITLCPAGTKKALGKGWGEQSDGDAWQHHRWTAPEIRRAFRLRGALNVGLLLGPSSGIVDIEADSHEQERAFAHLFDGCDPPVTPTYKSKRGKHRLFAWSPDLEPTRKGIADYKGLGIRIGANGKGAQSLMPPSITDGVSREWLVSLDECEPARFPQAVVERIVAANSAGAAGMLHSRHKPLPMSAEVTELAEVTESTVATAPTVLHEVIEWAIARTLPTGTGQRNRKVFEFARELKAIHSIADADVLTLRPYVQQWHRAALPFIATKPFTETWLDFAKAWTSIKYPAGQEPIAMIYQEAIENELPKVAHQYDEPELRKLVALCYCLQQKQGDGAFYLPCRTAGDLLGVSHVQANRWLRVLTIDKVLNVVSVGKRRKASEFRFIGAE